MSMTAQTADHKKIALPGISEFLALAFPHAGLWLAVLSLFAVNATWLAIDPRITVDPVWSMTCALSLTAAWCMAVLRHTRSEVFDWFLHRMWCALMTALMAVILMQNLKVLNHLVMTTAFPMADERLMGFDRMLHFDWLAYAKFMTTDPTITSLLFTAYNGMTFQGVIAVAALAILMDRPHRVIEIGFLMLSTAIICITIAALFPARAAMDMLADQQLLDRLAIGSGVYHIEQLMQLRGTNPVLLIPDSMQGLATFPSFHTCLGLIILWGSRGAGAASLAGAVLGLAILAATPIYGGHYLIDVIGGTAVMLFAALFWHFGLRSFMLPSQKLTQNSAG